MGVHDEDHGAVVSMIELHKVFDELQRLTPAVQRIVEEVVAIGY